MSNVPEYKRKKSTCEAIIKARHLATYTIQICANSKVFPPEYKSSLTDEIVHDAKEAYILAWKANSIRVTGQLAGELGTLRLQLQKEAILNCKSLLPLIENISKNAKPRLRRSWRKIKWSFTQKRLKPSRLAVASASSALTTN